MQQAKHIGKVVLTMPTGHSADSSPIKIEKNSTYLITGGLGALGLQLTQWIADQGATHIALTSRRAPSSTAQALIQQLEAEDVTVSVIPSDISQQHAVTTLIQELTQPEQPPLKGIIHAAGVLDDSLLSNLSWQQFEKVLAPKVQGTWHLHNATKALSLDFFVCFSSIAALLGSPGQANYAAANAFMDALMQHRRTLGLPALSINWGPWANVGMAAQLDPKAQDRLSARGITPIAPMQGLKTLFDLLTQPVEQPAVGVFSINWSKFTTQLPPGVNLPALRQITEQLQATAEDQGDRLQGFKQLQQLPAAERKQALIHHIQTEIADVLGYSSPDEIVIDQPLGDLGVDSLMAVELANQLEYNLGPAIPASFLFEHPTLQGLVIYLIEQLPELEFTVDLDV